ncbi:MAG: mechanosensitive ion channel family protein [Peptoniphilus sp.]|nr:mechanosensitive ion channel family protein [Peptoniphilus sp.]MDY3118666.1 mechanosensitive ion channel family protein [Peptoniphilus sp.]
MAEIVTDIRAFLFAAPGKLSIPGVVIAGLLLFLAARLAVDFIAKGLGKYIANREKKATRNKRRVITLTHLAKSASKYAIYGVALLIFLNLCRVNTSTLLATAGIGSLAVAMGAQEIIKDFLNGFFIIFDDQFAVGEYVECADKKGHVVSLGFRATVIRDFDGTLYTIPNSAIRIVTNRGRGRKRAMVVVPIDRKEDPDKAIEVIEGAAQSLKTAYPRSSWDVWGVTSFIPNGYEITVVAWDEAKNQFNLEYDLRKAIAKAMNEADINIPIARYEGSPGRGECNEPTVL